MREAADKSRSRVARRAGASAGVAGLLWLCAACAPARVPLVERYPELAEYEAREIDAIEFVNAEPFDADTLKRLIETRETRCRLLLLPICIPFTEIGLQEGDVSLSTLQTDVARLTLFYRRSGFFGTRVVPEIEEEEQDGEADESVIVRFLIERGDSVVLAELTLAGLEGVLSADSLEPELPLEEGELFDLSEFDASAEQVRQALLSRGHVYAEILRNYAVDTVANRATAELLAVPGPRVAVDSIIVRGAANLGREAALRQLTFEEGDVLEAEELLRSQRNLYGLELVQLASVTVAPDSLQTAPGDSARATVLVTVVEGPVHVVEASVGYGTADCFRSQVSWTSRSFTGGARRLSATGAVSRIGTGDPVSLGGVCPGIERERFSDKMDYLLALDFTQPYLFSPLNQLSASAFAERQSEPGIFQRVSEGGRVAVLRELGLRDALTISAEAARIRTDASAVIFCVAFLVCRPEDIAVLQGEARWRNLLGATLVRERTDRALDPSRGYVARTTASWAPGALGSEPDFRRWTLDASVYRSLKPDWVLAGHLRLGSYFGVDIPALEGEIVPPDDFLPPEDRFFAGGASSVRGFSRNELGRGVWVARPDAVEEVLGTDILPLDPGLYDFVPIGGTAVGVANLELRMPSPFRPDLVRLAVFADAGAVGSGNVTDLGEAEWKLTPGVGIRLRTPVGPVRADLAYNAEGPQLAPLFLPDPENPDVLRRVSREFRPSETFFSHLRFHLAVGQPF